MKALQMAKSLLKQAWLRRFLLLAVLTFLLWKSVVWAVAPALWGGSWLHSGEETAYELAQKMFGPVLLVRLWINDPNMFTDVDPWDILEVWRPHETIARLALIIVVLWISICILVFSRRSSRRLRPGEAESGSPPCQ